MLVDRLYYQKIVLKNDYNKMATARNKAKEIANRNFCCGHSGFTVGAALLTSEGKVYKGFNVENDGIQSICAERVAFTKALSEDNHRFSCIVVVGKKLKDKNFKKTLPCGYCRQFMSEYVKEDFIKSEDTDYQVGDTIDIINTDLIAGLPGDNFKYFSATFDKIVALEPQNITVHTFCVKKAADILTQNQNVYSIKGGDVGKCVDYSQLRAQAAGYLPYYMYRQKSTVKNLENVGFSQNGHESLYNIYIMEASAKNRCSHSSDYGLELF